MPARTAGRERISSKAEYLASFGSKQKAALDRAHDIRKFEIELYWKRATYFWAFSAAALAGYFTTSGGADSLNTYIICCLGFLFSLSWYLVNRGSSYWQRNWEKHVDLLEDETDGPLHKLVIARDKFRIFDLSGPYRFSPARINTTLSLMFVVLWLALIVRTSLPQPIDLTSWKPFAAVGTLTLLAALHMVWKGRTGRAREQRTVDFVMRGYL